MSNRPTHRCPLTDIKHRPHRRRKITISSLRCEASRATKRLYGDIRSILGLTVLIPSSSVQILTFNGHYLAVLL